MKWPPQNANAGREPGALAQRESTAPKLSAAKKSVNAKHRRELSYREICQIMGRNLRVIEPNERQLELFEEQ
jgi:hypothetical protein